MSETVELAYEQAGVGSDLVILHGLFGSARNWRGHVRELAKDFRGTSVDLRNHGQSPHADGMRYQDLAADLRAFLTRHGLADAVVLGHSMGGKTVMTMALQDPQWTGKIIVADIAPVAYPPRFADVLTALQAMPMASLRSRAEADDALRQWLPQDGLRTFLLTNLVRADQGFQWRVNLPAIVNGMHHVEGFPAFSQPSQAQATFLRGDRSAYVDAAGETEINRLFPHAELRTIANAGHWLHADQPAAVIQEIRRVLFSANA